MTLPNVKPTDPEQAAEVLKAAAIYLRLTQDAGSDEAREALAGEAEHALSRAAWDYANAILSAHPDLRAMGPASARGASPWDALSATLPQIAQVAAQYMTQRGPAASTQQLDLLKVIEAAASAKTAGLDDLAAALEALATADMRRHSAPPDPPVPPAEDTAPV